MKFDTQSLKEYTVIKTEEIKDLNSVGYLLSHNKTKARVAIMLNDDNNKVFSIGFRTPVENSTGVAHIVEHTVLCGSKKYPLKDPFVELLKGSLNTFMNAMTYPDKTIYPVASCNNKDFDNLMDVYLDAVFNPMIYEREEIFRQEGWNYTFNADDQLEVNGIVYNEMKGVFSKPDEMLLSKAMEKLFPDNNYGYESGGDPKHIPDLTYEDYLAFHKRYYHPSNSFIFLYGDLDINEKLDYIHEEYLSKFDYLEIDSDIKEQKPFEEMKKYTEYYPVGEAEDEKDKAYFAYLTTAGKGTDKNLYYAMKVLDYALLSMPGAPLKKKLIDAGIGTDIYGGENNLKERFFLVAAKGVNEGKEEEFKRILEETLKDIVKNGIDKDSLRAALNVIEFNYREADFGSYPKGIFYMIDSFESWLYDENQPFTHLNAGDTFKFLNEMVQTDYYEKLVEKYFIENNHKVLLSLLPKKGMAQAENKEQADKLAKYKASLSEEEIATLRKKEERLKKFHEMEESEENLKKIPALSIEDIDKETEPLIIEERYIGEDRVLFSNINTNKIAYLNVYTNIRDVDEKLIPYVGLLRSIIGNVDTDRHTYNQLSNIINMNSGGLSNDISFYANDDCDLEYEMFFETDIKIFYDKFKFAFDIIKELLLDTKYTDAKRIKEVLAETKGIFEAMAISRGNTLAVMRAKSKFSETAYYMDKMMGIDYYYFVKDLYKNFDEKQEEIIKNLKLVVDEIMKKDNLLVHVTCDEEGFKELEKYYKDFASQFSYLASTKQERHFEPKFVSEGIKTASTVQFVARCGEYTSQGYKYNGHFKVLSNILGYGYLWENIRDKGGAYGCMYAPTRNGKISLASYRDPKLRETNEVYDGLPEYLRNFNANEREMTKYIIGTMSNIDMPKTPRAKGNIAFTAYMMNVTREKRQKERDEILSTTKEDINELAGAFEAALSQDCICVIGNSDKIEENKDMFNEIINLFD